LLGVPNPVEKRSNLVQKALWEYETLVCYQKKSENIV